MAQGRRMKDQALHKLRPVVVRHELWSIPNITVWVGTLPGEEAIMSSFND